MEEESLFTIDELIDLKEYRNEHLENKTQETKNLIEYIIDRNGMIDVGSLSNSIFKANNASDLLNPYLFNLPVVQDDFAENVKNYKEALMPVLAELRSITNWEYNRTVEIFGDLSHILTISNINDLIPYESDEDENDFI